MVLGEGFEPPNPEGTDLQSAVFNHFTTPAYNKNGADSRIRTEDLMLTKQLL